MRLFEETLLRVAREEIGNGEDGGNNIGPHLDKYRGKAAPWLRGQPWCASFVSWCIHEAVRHIEKTTKHEPWPTVIFQEGLTRERHRAIAYPAMLVNLDLGHWLDGAEPGCLVRLPRGKHGNLGHLAICEVAYPDGRIGIIEGNMGKYPAKVQRRELAGLPRGGRLVRVSPWGASTP